MENVTFYHAGCPVCISAEQDFLQLVDQSKFKVEVVHLGEQKERIAEAEKAGIQSVPAVLLSGNALHINYGASLEDLKTA